MEITIGGALAYSVLGLAIVFLMLIVLMIVIKIMGAIINSTSKKAKDAPAAPAPVTAAPANVQGTVAPGAAGEIKLYDVSDKDAAMIMAIVADKIQKPLNELRFKSIREVK